MLLSILGRQTRQRVLTGAFHRSAAPRFLSTSNDITATSSDVASTAPTTAAVENASTTAQELLITASSHPTLQLGDLKAAGLCHNTQPGLIEYILELNHVYSGLPFWASIVTTAFAARTLLAPLTIRSQRQGAKLRLLQPEIKELMSHYKAAKEVGDRERTMDYMAQISEIYRREKVHPLAPVGLGLISGPVFMSFFLALRDIGTQVDLPALTQGGPLWFTDLTQPDPYYILPALAAGGFWLIMELGLEPGQAQSASMKGFFRVMSLFAFPFMSTMPAVPFNSIIHLYSFSTRYILYRHCQSTGRLIASSPSH